MKYLVEYKWGPMTAEEVNNFCNDNKCELVTITRDPAGMYCHYFKIV